MVQAYKITVYDYTDGESISHSIPDDQAPKRYDVEAFCVGGKEGVWAIFQHPTNEPLLMYAQGDDGHWWFAGCMDKHWFPDVAIAINACLANLDAR